MNILILVFSPSGSTLKVSDSLEKELVGYGHSVQLLDLTAKPEVFGKNAPVEYLEKTVRPHDVICFGSPVYEKHVEMYVQKLMKALPAPGGKWGKFAVPFFTYGGISTGVALREAVRILKSGGRQTVACMKLEASHIKTKRLKTRVNENMPGDEAVPFIKELAAKINAITPESKPLDISSLDYQNTKEKIMCAIMKEAMLHKKVYGSLIITGEACVQCGECIKKCPVQRIEKRNALVRMSDELNGCIHCFSCASVCERDAITFVNGEEGWAKIERIYGKVAKDGSFFRSMETPKSAIY